MESDKVEKLLEKYFEATSTAAEEATLKDYFSGDAIASHLERYAPMFRYFEEARSEQSTQPVELDRNKLGPMRSESAFSESTPSKAVPSKSPRSGSAQSQKVRLRPRTGRSGKKLWYTWGSVAAMVLIMVGIYFSIDTASTLRPSENDFASLEDEYTQEEIAAAQEALALLSTKFNEGTEQLSHLNEFEKNTNRFLSEKQ